MKPAFTFFPHDENWVRGICGAYTFCALLFDEPSRFGINGGRVSKLEIRNSEKTITANYDRGWDVKPKTEEQKAVFQSVLDFLETAPKRFA